jgi:hypothetical protein
MDALGLLLLTFGGATFVLGALLTALYYDAKGGD